jgi:hypothetical protein
MNWLAPLIVGAFGIGLVGSGLFHHVKFRERKSDPVLIGACYVFGGALMAACVV